MAPLTESAAAPEADDRDEHAPPLNDRPVELEIQIPKIMRVGLLAALAFMLAGLALAAAAGGNAQTPLRIREVPAALAALDPRGMLGAGIFLLLLTPLARVAASVVHFARERDRLYVALTAVVVANLALAVWLGTYYQ